VEHEFSVSVTYPSPAHARRVERAVAPEVGEIDDDRSETRLRRSEETLTLAVAATDLVALRAGLNSWLSLLDVAERAGAC
jgi:KEOPS complex subunit Pcc1